MLGSCRNLAALWLVLWGGCITLWAAPKPHFTVDYWDAEKGLPGNVVIAVTQTRDGYLWLGTLYGLVRFDGVRFETFNEGNTRGLNSSRVIKLFEDSRTNLWIGTDAGGIFLARDGKVTSVATESGARPGRLASICEDTTGAVWFYTAEGQFWRYQQGRTEAWLTGPTGPSRYRAMVSTDGKLWLGTDTSLTVRPMPSGPPSNLLPGTDFPVTHLDYVMGSQRGGLWVLADGYVRRWNGGGFEKECNWPYPWKATNAPPIGVKAACEDTQGNLVIGTERGIFWFDGQGNAAQINKADSGLTHDTVLSLCMDREGDLWAGTDAGGGGGGLHRIKRQVFEILEGSEGKVVQSACEDGEGGLWVGYYGKRIDHWQRGRLEEFTYPQRLVTDGVKSVFVDAAQNVWATSAPGGLFLLQQGVFLPAPHSELLRAEQISVLYQDRSRRLWAGSQTGLARLDGAGWKLFVYTNGPPLNIRAIAQDCRGDFWLGTQGAGLARLHQGPFSWYGKTNGLPSDNITSLLADPDGVVWVGTSSGLARFQDGQWTSYAGHLDSASSSVSYLLDDGLGFLWIGSNSGLLRARRSELNDFAARLHGTSGPPEPGSLHFRSYGKPDGLPNRECSQGWQPAACRTADGRLWFPTIEGLATVDPVWLTPNSNAPPVVIESVLLDGLPQGTNTLRAPAPVSVTVPPDKESLEIHYTSLNLSAPDKGRFRYRLASFENTWTLADALRRYARYPKLPHGRYTFQVQACNEDGYWSPNPACLAVAVLPPFWQTWWFLSAATVCLLAMIVSSVHYVSTQKLQRELAAMRQQEALEKERGRIARDLHDQLGANLTQVALLGEMAEADKEMPDEVEAHARQIAQTARDTTRALDEIVWTVNPSNDTLDGVVNYVCKYAQEYLALANLRYRLEVPAQLPHTPVSPELRHNVFLAAKEAVNNVVKHSQASSAWLRLRLESDRFILEIEDNGRGLAAGDENKGRNGLRNMRKRMEDIGGQFEAVPAATGGTLVRLTAPLLSGA
jgi:ligand-binding sensor domain-containing protein/signal transduction histidine kinase